MTASSLGKPKKIAMADEKQRCANCGFALSLHMPMAQIRPVSSETWDPILVCPTSFWKNP